MFRTRFKREIVAEFLPPARATGKQRVIILCDGLPSVPRKQPLVEFLSTKGYWVFYPRYRGAWESDGEFLAVAPDRDILDIVSELARGVTETAFRRKFALSPDEVFVIGGSFGGATAIMASLDRRINKIVANCPVVDWGILSSEQKEETSNTSYAVYLREAFGRGYRLSAQNWRKLMRGNFFNPVRHVNEFDGSKLLIFQTKDDPYIPWRGVQRFAADTGAQLILNARGGHGRTEVIVQKNWERISRFLRGR
jgi:pimeloyl-ACP methyl ester carboxylesterase